MLENNANKNGYKWVQKSIHYGTYVLPRIYR